MDPTWIVLGFSLAALAAGYGWGFGEDVPADAADPDSPQYDPLARRPDSTVVALKRFWNKAFWENRVSLLVVAVVITPLGGFIAGPVFAGRAAEIWGRKAGYKHSLRLGIVVGVVWLAVFGLAVFGLALFVLPGNP